MDERGLLNSSATESMNSLSPVNAVNPYQAPPAQPQASSSAVYPSAMAAPPAPVAGSSPIAPPVFQPMVAGAPSVPPTLAHAFSTMPTETLLHEVEWHQAGCTNGISHSLAITDKRIMSWQKTCCGPANHVDTSKVDRVSRATYEKTHDFDSAIALWVLIWTYAVAVIIFCVAVGSRITLDWEHIKGFVYIAAALGGLLVLRILYAYCFPITKITIQTRGGEEPFAMMGSLPVDDANATCGNVEHALRVAQKVVPAPAATQLSDDVTAMFDGEEEHLKVCVQNSVIRVTSARLIVETSGTQQTAGGAAAAGATGMGGCCDRKIVTEPIGNICRIKYARTPAFKHQNLVAAVVFAIGGGAIGVAISGVARSLTNGPPGPTMPSNWAEVTTGAPSAASEDLQSPFFIVGCIIVVWALLLFLMRHSSIVFSSSVLTDEPIHVFTGGVDQSAEIEAAVRFAQDNLN